MNNINNLEIPAEEILSGDRFVKDGQFYWTARSHGELVTSRTREPLIRITVQFVDGGVEDRYWDPGTILEVER
jgi:hypothetical protein